MSRGLAARTAQNAHWQRDPSRYLPRMATEVQEIDVEQLKSRLSELRRFL